MSFERKANTTAHSFRGLTVAVEGTTSVKCFLVALVIVNRSRSEKVHEISLNSIVERKRFKTKQLENLKVSPFSCYLWATDMGNCGTLSGLRMKMVY